ncbi:MAG TPA: hypothetical protein VJ549_09945 [Geothrix sp.]|nr:hypothetical protein [Geothrix sp.]
MPDLKTLLLLSVLPCWIHLNAQDKVQHPLPSGLSTGASAFFYQIPVRDMSKLEDRPVLSKAVAVEDLGIRIPPPPPSVHAASDGLRSIQAEAARSMVFLKKELDQLNKDQAAGLAVLQKNPDMVPLGTDSDFFKALLSLSRDEEVFRARRAFVEAGRQAKGYKKTSAETADILVDAMRSSIKHDGERRGEEDGPKTPVPWVWAENAKNSLDANGHNQMLATYVKAWEDYSRAITHFVDRVADALKVPEKELPPSTMLLVRLLKIQVFRIYTIQIQEQVQMWAQAAQVGERPRADPYPMGADRN